jgi:hypothetical protein
MSSTFKWSAMKKKSVHTYVCMCVCVTGRAKVRVKVRKGVKNHKCGQKLIIGESR